MWFMCDWLAGLLQEGAPAPGDDDVGFGGERPSFEIKDIAQAESSSSSSTSMAAVTLLPTLAPPKPQPQAAGGGLSAGFPLPPVVTGGGFLGKTGGLLPGNKAATGAV